MIDVNALRIYITANGPIEIGGFFFTLTVHQEDESFSINLKVRQRDTKEDHLIRFRVGIGKHAQGGSSTHDPREPHFELDYYTVGARSFSATLYFEFDHPTDEMLMEYARGTLVVIAKVLRRFFEMRNLDRELLDDLIAGALINEELSSSEPVLIDALYECYKNSTLVVRRKGHDPIIVRTEHNLEKFLGFGDLMPIYEPLLERIRHDSAHPRT